MGSGQETRPEPNSGEAPYCSGVPPGPGNGLIRVPSAVLLAIWLFLNDCRVPLADTPVPLPVTVESPIQPKPCPPATLNPVPALNASVLFWTNAVARDAVLVACTPKLV